VLAVWALLGLLLAAATLDFWSVSLAEHWLGRVGYSMRTTSVGRTVEWEGLDWVDEASGLHVRAAKLRVSAPWRILRERKLNAEGEGWVVDLTNQADGNDAETPDGDDGAWETWVPALREAGRELERRVGELRLRSGVLRLGDEEIEVDELWVKGGVVSVTLRGHGQTLEIESDLRLAAAWGTWREAGVRFQIEAWPEKARAEVYWAENTARLAATFAEGDWRPAAWRLVGEGWRVPAARLGLGRSIYGELAGGFEAQGDAESFSVEVGAVARPATEGMPDLRLDAKGGGDAREVRIERFELLAPQGRARLSAPVAWRWAGGWASAGEAIFDWEADLAALSGGVLRGRTEGRASWVEGGDAGARVRWEARGAGLAWEHIESASLTLRGESDAESTTVSEVLVEAPGGARVEARGRLIHGSRALEGAVIRATADGAMLAPWLPAGMSIKRAEVELRGGGAWPGLEMAGAIQAETLTYDDWAADTLAVDVDGRWGSRVSGRVEARRGDAHAEIRGEWTPEGVRADQVFLRRKGGAELLARAPLLVEWAPGATRVAAELTEASGSRLSVDWREDAESSLLIHDLGSEWLNDWRRGAAWPELRIRSLRAKTGMGADGWRWAESGFDARWISPAGEVWARGEGRLDATGARLSVLEAGRGGDLLLSGAGLVPWGVRGDRGNAIEPVPGGRWDLEMRTRAGAAWWNELAKAAKLGLEGPEVSLRVEGEARTPRAVAKVGAERVNLSGEGLPEGGLELAALRAEAELAEGEIVLRNLRAKVDGQPVEAEGRLALAAGDWARLRERPYVWLRDHAEARVAVPRAEVSAFARYLPTLLAPQGTVSAELRLSPGAKLDGALSLVGAATRPLGGFGVLQDVDVMLALRGMEVKIERMRAMAGGQELVVTGGARRAPGRMPALDLAVKARRFPLLRKPGLLLRGDLDLTVKTTDEGRTRLGGEVVLRDSLFLADIRSFVTPGGGRGEKAARSRPPYFSVENPPLAEWELGLRVGGERFLRLRTPVFEGTGSARFNLVGTLREPRASGEFWVERGNILFPFASFAVQEGAVRLKASDPYTPVLDFRANGRRLGYDLRLELTGTAETPRMQLTSSPPLEAETVLLMITAGAAPEQGAGSASRTQRLAAVGAYVGRDLLRGLGLGGTDEERLTISSGEKVSRAGRETYGFEFKLNDKWALTGEYDEFDAYNVGVLRRFGPSAETEKTTEAPEGKEAGDAR